MVDRDNKIKQKMLYHDNDHIAVNNLNPEEITIINTLNLIIKKVDSQINMDIMRNKNWKNP